MRSHVPVRASIFILHYGSTESGIQWINKFLWLTEESRKAVTSAIFTSTSCDCTPTPSLPIQSILRLFHLFYALHNDVLYTCDLYQYSLCNATPPYLNLILSSYVYHIMAPWDTLFSLSRLSWWHVTLCHVKRTSGIVFCHLLATPRQVDLSDAQQLRLPAATQEGHTSGVQYPKLAFVVTFLVLWQRQTYTNGNE